MTDAYDDLFLDAKGKDEIIAAALRGKVELTPEGHVLFKEDMPARNKVIAYLLARRVLAERGIKEELEVGPSRIAEAARMPAGTVKRLVRELAEDRILDGNDGTYTVRDDALYQIQNELSAEGVDD